MVMDKKWLPKATISSPGIVLPGDGFLVGAEGAVSAVRRASWQYNANSFDSALDTNWALANNAIVVIDSTSQAIVVRSFSPVAQNGCGFNLQNLPSCTSLRFTFHVRASSTPGTPGGVVFRLFSRALNVGSPTGAWNSGYYFPAFTLSDANWFQYQATVPLATLGYSVGDTRQMELAREVFDSGDTLSVAMYLLSMTIEAL